MAILILMKKSYHYLFVARQEGCLLDLKMIQHCLVEQRTERLYNVVSEIKGIRLITVKQAKQWLEAVAYRRCWGIVRVERPDYSSRTLSEPDVRNYRIRLPT